MRGPLYARGGAAVEDVRAAFPAAIIDGAVDRQRLSEMLAQNPKAFATLEAIVHPLVRKAQGDFLKQCRDAGEPLAVLDIPLLFETGRQDEVDVIVVVSAPAEIQRQRTLARPGMTVEKLEMILARQMPDTEKRRRADVIIDTSQGIDYAHGQVRALVENLRRKAAANHA